MIVLENIVFTASYISAKPGAPLNNNGAIDTNPQSGCKFGAPGTIYSKNLDVLSVNMNGTFTQKPIYLYGNSSSMLSIRTLDLKAYSSIQLVRIN